MLTRRRVWVIAAALASAALWGLLALPDGPDQASAAHSTNPSGQIWTAGSVASTWKWYHVNVWRCRNSCPPNTADLKTDCWPRATDANTALATGCGGHSSPEPGFTFNGHDARAYNTRTGSGVGHQAVLALARNPHPGERIILSAFLNHPGRSDAAAFTDKLLELAARNPRLAAAAAAVYDGALHAADMIRLLNHAIIPIAKTRRNPGGTPAATPLGPHQATLADGTQTSIDITAIDGTPTIARTGADGETWHIPLIRAQTRIRRNKHQPAAVYTHWRIPTARDNPEAAALVGEHAGAAVTIRHNPRKPSQALRINRALRAIPASDPDYDRLYGLREDAESANSHLKERLRRNRAHTTGRQRLQLNLNGYQSTPSSPPSPTGNTAPAATPPAGSANTNHPKPALPAPTPDSRATSRAPQPAPRQPPKPQPAPKR